MESSKKLKKLVLAALFAAFICLTTAYILHIPTGINGGYIHIGDSLIYLASCLLPMPYAMAAASIGGALADILSGSPIWAIPTMIIKPLLVIAFTYKSEKIICKRNIIALFISGIVGVAGYFIADCIMGVSFMAKLAMLPIDMIQPVASGAAFVFIALALDKINIKNKLKEK